MEHTTENYRWSWDRDTDLVHFEDGQGRHIAHAPLKPRLVFADGSADPSWDEAAVTALQQGNTVAVSYRSAQAELSLVWSFEQDHFSLSPVEVSSPHASRWARVELLAGLQTHYALLPGLSMSSFLGPVVDLHSKLNLTTTLGAGAMRGPGLAQQWGLPSHWLDVYDTAARWNASGAHSRESAAMCLGLASLPSGDFWVRTGDRNLTLVLNVRSDLWNLFPEGRSFSTGLDLLFFFGKDLEEAPKAYYRHLAALGHKAGSAYPALANSRDVRSWTLFNTWGSQVSEPIQPEQFDQARLEKYWQQLQASGLKVGHFVIDDKWEGTYGVLRHDEKRFPAFDDLLGRVRKAGLKVGLWAAFLRCENPSLVGLTEDHLMKGRDGQVLWFAHQTARYGIYDISQDKVAEVLGRLARDFMRRYRPDLIKFDFGYELPTLDVSCPANPVYRGEALLRRGLEVLLGAMKAENPELVVFYYGLSPLLAPYYDLHSTDDMVYCPRDYDVEGNRRMNLAAFLGECGMPVSSSTGYDWATASDLWFDAAALGVPGTLLPFGPDEAGGGPSAEVIARFNGLAALARPSATYQFETLGGHPHGGHRAMTTAGWRRLEQGKTVLLALRPGSRVAGLETEGQLVLASFDEALLDGAQGTTRHFGFVGWPGSSFRLAAARPTSWTVTQHWLGAEATQMNLSVPEAATPGTLDFRWPDIGPHALEWVEFQGS